MDTSIESFTPQEINEAEPWQQILHRWFVLYNPLYILSALSVLGGVFFIDRALADSEVPWALGVVGLVAVTELYELLLVAAAAILHSRGLRRPAVMLGLVAMVFLVDATFHTEALAHAEPWDLAAVLCWCLLALIKVGLWRRVLDLQVSHAAGSLIALGLLAIGLLPWLLDTGWVSARTLFQLAAWIAAGAAIWGRAARPVIKTRFELDAESAKILSRAIRFFWTLLATGVIARLWLAAVAHDLSFELSYLAPAFWLLLSTVSKTLQAWTVSACLLVTLIGAEPTLALAVALTGGLTIAWRAYECQEPEMLSLALAWLALPAWHLGADLPEAWRFIGLTLAYGLLAGFSRTLSSLMISLSCLLAALLLIEMSLTAWGLALLTAGFLALGLGVALNLRLHHKT